MRTVNISETEYRLLYLFQ